MTLPPLPAPHATSFYANPLFTDDQMRAYGEACAAAERERLTTDCAGLRLALNRAESRIQELLVTTQGEPVAWRSKTRINNDFDSNWCLTSTEPPQTPRTIAIEPLYIHPPQQRKPLTRSMQAEIECDCLVAWNASTYGHSKQDTVHPMFLSAFILGYWTAERAHGITGEPT